MSSVITEMFQIVQEVIGELIDALINTIDGVTSLFYTPNGGFTFVGTLLLIGLGFTLVFWAFRFIRGLIRR